MREVTRGVLYDRQGWRVRGKRVLYPVVGLPAVCGRIKVWLAGACMGYTGRETFSI